MNKLAQYLNQHLEGEVVASRAVRERYATDSGLLALLPDMVAYPRSTHDIRKLVSFSWQLAKKGHKLSVTPRGGGLNTASAAIGQGIVMDLSAHMNRILEYDAKQRLIRLQPGITVAALKNALYLEGAYVPALDRYDDAATIGGIIAGGHTAMPLGEWVEQVEIVLANGDTLQTGKVSKRELSKRKGQAGFEGDVYRGLDALIDDNRQLLDDLAAQSDGVRYGASRVKQKDGSLDLLPVLAASQGTLGVISELILKAEFLPSSRHAVIGVFDDEIKARDVIDAAGKIDMADLKYYNQTVLVRAATSGKTIDLLKESLTNGPAAVMLVATFNDSSDRAQAKKAKKLVKLFDQFGARTVTFDDEAAGDYQTLRSLVGLAIQADDDETALPIADGLMIPLERFEEFNREAAALAVKHHTAFAMYGRPLESIWTVRPYLSFGKVSGKQAALKLIAELGTLADSYGGTITGEQGEGRLQAAAAQASWDEATKRLLDDIKALFDPEDILNTGVKQPVDKAGLTKLLRDSYVPASPSGLTHF